MHAICPCPETDQSVLCPPSSTTHLRPVASKLPLSFMFPNQNPTFFSLLLHTFYLLRTSYSTRFYQPNQIWWRVEKLSSSLCSFLHYPVNSSLLGTHILLITLTSNKLNLRSHQFERPSYNLQKKIIIMILLGVLIFKFVNSKLEDKRFCTEN